MPFHKNTSSLTYLQTTMCASKRVRTISDLNPFWAHIVYVCRDEVDQCLDVEVDSLKASQGLLAQTSHQMEEQVNRQLDRYIEEKKNRVIHR